jgi:Glycosyl hydrolase family 3 C terminal domain.
VTLIRDNDNLVPLRISGRALVVQYMPETELRAGRIFGAAIRAGRARTSSNETILAKIGPNATRDVLDSLSRVADNSDIVVIATYVRRVEGEGRFAVPQQIAAWIDAVARKRKTVVVALGNPYVLRQFPGVNSYLLRTQLAMISREPPPAHSSAIRKSPVASRSRYQDSSKPATASNARLITED